MPELTPNYKFKKPIPDKEVADITVINENFDIADEEIKKINDTLEKKADPNHTHDDRYYTESEIDMKFKNFCPYAVGDVYVTTSTTNPATRWTGTTWQKIEGRFLLGTSGSGASKATGGSMSKTISVSNLPSHNHSASVSSINISGEFGTGGSTASILYSGETSGSFSNTGVTGKNSITSQIGSTTDRTQKVKLNNSHTHTVTVNTTGSGSALDVTPSYYTCHMWLRLT